MSKNIFVVIFNNIYYASVFKAKLSVIFFLFQIPNRSLICHPLKYFAEYIGLGYWPVAPNIFWVFSFFNSYCSRFLSLYRSFYKSLTGISVSSMLSSDDIWCLQLVLYFFVLFSDMVF